ncbi:MAG: metal ABC transporter solute-binding protein, Zn/Mn family [Acidimicrobiales bacterium]
MAGRLAAGRLAAGRLAPVALVVASVALAACGAPAPAGLASGSAGGGGRSGAGELRIVAAESFWGSLAAQIAGDRAQVTSIVRDPNADPHEHEATPADARAFADASYVVVNGVGYDGWADKLLAANPSSHRRVLVVGRLVHKSPGDNPHLWYDPAYVSRAVTQMAADLSALDPRDAGWFHSRLASLRRSLAPYQAAVEQIRDRYAGTPVASTESVLAYLASAAGLNLVSPASFMKAVSEGTDPPVSSVVTFRRQLAERLPRILVYNTQTVTPITTAMERAATAASIPSLGVTETLQPPGTTFQAWMAGELARLESALRKGARR